MALRKYTHLAMALCISAIIVAVTAVSVSIIYESDRTNVSNHILTRLQATSGLIDLWQNDYQMSVRLVAEDPVLIDLVSKLVEGKTNAEDAGNTLDQWLRPIYLGRGFEGHSIITPDLKIILASSPAFIGKPVTTPESKEVIARAIKGGTGVGRPSEATYQVRMLDKIAPEGTLYQLGCAPVKNKKKLLGVLCLRQDPYRNFFAMLGTGFSGTSGEAYAVNRAGYIISPTRFGNTVVKNKQTNQPEFIKGLQARVPKKTKMGALLVDQNVSPLTESVSAAIKHGQSGFINGYADYRGAKVVGAVKWLPDMDIGIVVEQDAAEVYGPLRLSINAIIALAVIAIVLINMLLIVQARGRRSLAEREQRMRAFLDNFPGLAHMRDSSGKFLIANKQMEDFLHVTRKEIIGHTHTSLLLPKKYIAQLVRGHEEVIRTGQVVETVQELGEFKYNNIEWLKTIRFPVFDAETKEVYAVGTILLDITEQTRNSRELEAIRVNLEKMVAQRTTQFEAAKLEAEQAARAKSDFLANMSHEIRTPMNAIIGLSHLATLVSDDPKLRSYLQRIHQSSSHLLSIINDILDFSKIEAGQMRLDRIDFSLEDTLNNVIGLLWEKADSKGLELLLRIDTDIPDNLNGDALRIGQILINFASNAVKFTESGEVILRAKKLGETAQSIKIRFEVQDTGIGIPAERFDQLFKPFHQLDSSSTRRFEGTGLGLTISKNLVELMGGKLDIQSEVNAGSTFSVELTINKCLKNDLIHYQKMSLDECRVLVVDDNQHARDILTYMLRALALDVTEAHSGTEAIELIKTRHTEGKPFEMIFIDWKMPGISGVDTAKNIHDLKLKTNPKLVLVSAHTKHEMDSSAENLLNAILTKPVTRSALYDTVTGLLKNSCARNESSTTLDIRAYKKLAKATVLLVDDNDMNQDVVKELLNLINVKVTTANNGQQALDFVQQKNFDMILMDVQMPVMDGMEATRRIRQLDNLNNLDNSVDLNNLNNLNNYRNLPIIAMTANALADDREHCLQVGMNDYVSKPIDPETLFRTMLRWYSPSQQQVVQISTSESYGEDSSLSSIKKIPGLDVSGALDRLLGNSPFYLKLIQRFINERSNIVELIEAAINKNNMEDAIRQIHTFKSLAGTIGAIELQELSLQIEITLQQGDIADDLLQEFRIKLQNLIAELNKNLMAVNFS